MNITFEGVIWKRRGNFSLVACKVYTSGSVCTSYSKFQLSLPPYLSSDLKTISKFAQLEYKKGEPERGKTLFEGIIESHPKRWDLWSVYMDMEAGQGDIQSLR